MLNQRNAESPITEHMLIAGEWIDGPARLEINNPAKAR
jgi:hypothetical protein